MPRKTAPRALDVHVDPGDSGGIAVFGLAAPTEGSLRHDSDMFTALSGRVRSVTRVHLGTTRYVLSPLYVLIATRAIAAIVNPIKKARTGKINAKHMASSFISVTNADLETNSVHLVYCEKTAPNVGSGRCVSNADSFW
jgi:hypothetical protein